MVKPDMDAIRKLSVSDRLALVEEIWNSISLEPFAEADEAFVLGEPVAYEGLMHDPRRGWYRVRVPVIVSEASCVGEGWFVVTLKIAGEPEDLLAN